MNVVLGEDYMVLAIFIGVKVSIFYFSNLYYRMWRYIAVAELAGYFASAFSAAVILGFILFFKDKGNLYSRYFLMVDFLLTFTGTIFSRLVYRWLMEMFYKSRESQKKVLIYGAGDSGYLLIKELLQNRKHELSPVGWIDDDHSKHNMYLYGYKVFGGFEEVIKICEKTQASMILISSKEIDGSYEKRLNEVLIGKDITVGRFSVNLTFNNEEIPYQKSRLKDNNILIEPSY
jgi:UDP-GlcNAc:undecaprenyl-phosphate GlcNAc-1-phosphate transferase